MKKKRKTLAERLEDTKNMINDSQERMLLKYSLKRDRKFEKAWSIAWEFGHSNGISEVEYYFDELVELIK